jgi:protein phosphatase
MNYAAGNAQHIGARPEQQDAFGFSDPRHRSFTEHAGFLGVVADGMGGMAGGREASQTAVRVFLRAYEAKSPHETIPDALYRCLEEANRAVCALDVSGDGPGTGTTLAAAVLHESGLHWISAGDSRVYLLRDGRLTCLTADHTYGNELDESAAEGRISHETASTHPQRGSLTSFLGRKEVGKIDRTKRPFPVDSRDRVIICSDGFYRAMTAREIIQAFADDLNTACDNLLRQALHKQRAHQDNLTVIAMGNDPEEAQVVATGKTWPKIALGLAAVVLLSVAAAGGWYFGRGLRPSAPSTAGTREPAPETQPKPPASVVQKPAEKAGRRTASAPQAEFQGEGNVADLMEEAENQLDKGNYQAAIDLYDKARRIVNNAKGQGGSETRRQNLLAEIDRLSKIAINDQGELGQSPGKPNSGEAATPPAAPRGPSSPPSKDAQRTAGGQESSAVADPSGPPSQQRPTANQGEAAGASATGKKAAVVEGAKQPGTNGQATQASQAPAPAVVTASPSATRPRPKKSPRLVGDQWRDYGSSNASGQAPATDEEQKQ